MANLNAQWYILGVQVTLPIVLASIVALLLIPLLLSRIISSASKTGPSSAFLLAGPRDSGKTSLLLYLQEKKLVATQTSTTSVTVRLPPSSLTSSKPEKGDSDDNDLPIDQPFHMTDTPGHPKLRSLALTGIARPDKTSYIGVIYMLDSGDLSAQGRITDTVAYLYEILVAAQQRYTRLSESSSGSLEPLPVLIACNKSELFTALPANKISALLQSELGKMKETKRKGLLNPGADAEDDENIDEILGDENSNNITWEGLREYGVDISIHSGSIKKEDIGQWKSWISSSLEA